MKVYVSIPITGFPIENVKKWAEIHKLKLQENGHEVVTPFDVCATPNMPYSHYMGEDIKALLECDAIFLAPGWQLSKGCKAEYEIAKIYEKLIISLWS